MGCGYEWEYLMVSASLTLTKQIIAYIRNWFIRENLLPDAMIVNTPMKMKQ